MKICIRSFFIISFLIIEFCFKGISQNVPVIRIDPSLAYGGSVSNFFDEIEYIPLETTNESLLGAADKLVITDSSIIVGDWDTKCVYFFSLKGKFINKIKLPYGNSLGMDISYEKDQYRIAIRAINWATEKGECKYYNLEGSPLNIPNSKVNKENATLIYLGNNYNIGTESSYLYKGEQAKDSIYKLVSIFKGNSRYKSFLPYNQLRSLALSRLLGGYSLIWGHPIRVQDGNFYIAEPLTFSVYKINTDTAIQSFQFILPYDRVIPKNLIEQNERKSIDSLVDLIAYNNKIILQISNIFFYKNYLLFKLMPRVYISKPGSESEFQYNFMYDTLNKKLISLERLTPDSSNYYLPAFGHTTNRDGIEYFNDYFYTSLSSLEMINQWDKTKNKVNKYPPVLDKYFNAETRKSNPVIVKLKLRKEL